MRNETRKLYSSFLATIGSLNQVESASTQFTVAPSVQQTLESRIQESSDFLNQINIAGVRDLKGEKIGLGVSGPIAGRTDTSTGSRQPRNLIGLDDNAYECKLTEFDTAIPYATLDSWAKFPDFQERIRDAIVKRQALDRICIGFNGTSAAAASNRTTNPLLQDVNIGWLQKYRTHAAARVLSSGATANKVKVGVGGDYKNLDALVYDAVNSLIEPWYQDDTSLVAICGRKLLSDKYFPLINNNDKPTEKLATDLIISQKRLGGLQAVRAPYVPDGKIFITSLSNLSIYWQEDARRRHIKDEPERNRIANYESSNDAYVIEDYGFGCLIENIEFIEPDGEE
jgi:P2 family phage major capsid protein